MTRDYLNKNKIAVFFYLISFFIPFITFILTLAPSVTFGDSGELITAAYFLGISHPPGSPLWTILAKLFTLLPINSIAWRVNLSSAFFSSCAAFLFFVIQVHVLELMQLKVKKIFLFCIALVSSLLFSFSRTVWTVSVTAEIWSLNNVIFSLLILNLFFWVKTKKNLYLYTTALILGLSLTNHYFFLILFPILILWVLYNRIGLLKDFKAIGLITAFFLCGLALYLYLPIRARANPAINWGNPSSFASFKNYIERRQFGLGLETRQELQLGGVYLPVSPFTSDNNVVSRTVSSLNSYAIALNQEFSFFFLLVSFTGMILFLLHIKENKQARPWFLFLLLSFLVGGWGFAFVINAAKPIDDTYFTEYLLSFFILTVWFGICMAWIGDKIMIKRKKFGVLIALSIGILILSYQIYTNYKVSDWSNNQIAYFHGMNILNTADENAIIIADKNNWIFPLLYLTKVEKKRPDVTIYDRTNNLFELVYKRQTIPIRSYDDLEKHRQIIEQDIAKKYPNRPFYYAADKNFENYNREVDLEGILYKSRKFKAKKIDFAFFYNNILSIQKISWIESDSKYALSYYHLRFGDKLQQERDEKGALAEYEKAYQIAQGHEVALNNVATSYARLGDLDRAMKIFKEVLARNPKNIVALGNLAELYHLNNQSEEAIRTYRELLKHNPNNVNAAVGLVGILIRGDGCDEADEIYTLLKGQGFNSRIVNNIGVCFARQSAYDKAKEYWEIALQIDPNYEGARDNLEKLESLSR